MNILRKCPNCRHYQMAGLYDGEWVLVPGRMFYGHYRRKKMELCPGCLSALPRKESLELGIKAKKRNQSR